jgi:hypothetical protein
MEGEFLLILGVCAFVFLAGTVVSWVLPASSLGEWTEEEKEKKKQNRWWSIK